MKERGEGNSDIESANELLRKKLRDIENMAIGALHHQPESPSKCFSYLSSALDSIHEISSIDCRNLKHDNEKENNKKGSSND